MGSNVLYTGFFGKQFFNQQLKKFFRHPPRIDTWPKIDNKKKQATTSVNGKTCPLSI